MKAGIHFGDMKLRGHICLGLSIRYIWIRSRTVRDRILKLHNRTSMKNKGTRIFFFLNRTCCRVMPLFRLMQCNLVNKIYRELLELGS